MNEVEQYYDKQALLEWQREDRHPTEFAVTRRVMKDYLPPAPAEVLDVGGGPGKFAIALTGWGYSVTLVDLSQGNLALAKEKATEAEVSLSGYIYANALDLSCLRDRQYDAILLMGPLYHLLDVEERRQAVEQALFHLKPGGVIFPSFITRFSPLRDASWRIPLLPQTDMEYTYHLLETGRHDRPDPGGTGFTRAYFAHPDEILPLMESTGVQTLDLVGVAGVVSGHEAATKQLVACAATDPVAASAWEIWVDLNYRMGHEPSLRGASDHLLYVGLWK